MAMTRKPGVGYSVILDSPEHVQALGAIVAHWALVESALERLLRDLLKLEEGTATLIYQNFVGTRAKIDLLIRLNSALTTPETLRAEIAKALQEAADLNTERNAYVHSMWATQGDDHPGELLRIRQILPGAMSTKTMHEREWLKPEQLYDLADRLSRANIRIHVAASQLWKEEKEAKEAAAAEAARAEASRLP